MGISISASSILGAILKETVDDAKNGVTDGVEKLMEIVGMFSVSSQSSVLTFRDENAKADAREIQEATERVDELADDVVDLLDQIAKLKQPIPELNVNATAAEKEKWFDEQEQRLAKGCNGKKVVVYNPGRNPSALLSSKVVARQVQAAKAVTNQRQALFAL